MTKVDVLQLVAKTKVYIQGTVQPKKTDSLSVTSVKRPRTKVAIKTYISSVVIRHTFYKIKLFYHFS